MVDRLESGFDSIPSDRKKHLEKLAYYVHEKVGAGDTARLNFICTHNSRRSHLAAIWAKVAAHHFEMDDLETYSGGTEATAFNPRAVQALEQAGLRVEQSGSGNPRYRLYYASDQDPLICFSKKFDHPDNPDRGFAAIMTCSDADENCPFVPGTEYRASLTYQDPKISDGTPEEEQTYDERCFQIAVEMFHLINLASQNSSEV